MQDNGFIPPMSPDDFAALAAFAGPIYQESKTIESFTSNNPIPNAIDNYGSMNIRQGLEQAQRLTQASMVQPPRPMYVPPAVDVQIPNILTSPTPYSPPTQSFPTPVDESQLEFSFNPSKQDDTNNLLREISKKLSKIITALESKPSEDTVEPKKSKYVKNQI